MEKEDQFTKWALEIQSIAQAGLHYGHDIFDKERYQRLREIAGEMMQADTGLPKQTIKTLFLGDEGYQTPKLDTRAAIFKDNKILMVKEHMSQDWSLPGGWNEYNLSPVENCIKEAYEESGRRVKPVLLIALQDRNKHNQPKIATKIIKAFFLCKELGGNFQVNDETDDCRYFGLDNLPKLSIGRNSYEQIEMCFKANQDPEHWKTIYD
ncbi:NUDIX hydrolase [uncultured Lactobacillus sp.]|uniref:NUDIX hydrolase N-terminal domain-containing protein n=1 Tax=uncultured Lactobacillus sp. TaxID=153152 RepID=UPI00260231B6|nr:NUDIX hydrolase [uncultured Lactobacillus sp.]